jgi:hypothetical protein
MARTPSSRIHSLARRVGWLDRYRRVIAVATPIALSPAPYVWLRDGGFGNAGGAVFAIVILIVMWATLEVGLAWLTAVWETECAELSRHDALPRAIVHKS